MAIIFQMSFPSVKLLDHDFKNKRMYYFVTIIHASFIFLKYSQIEIYGDIYGGTTRERSLIILFSQIATTHHIKCE